MWGGDDAVGGGEQGAAGGDGLGGDHVQPGGEDLAAVEGVGQVLFHDQRPPGAVEQDDAVLHFGDGVPVDEAGVFRGQGTVEGDDVRAGQQLVHGNIPGGLAAQVAGVLVKGQYLHPQRRRDAAGPLADAPVADDAHDLPLQLDERGLPKAPVGAAAPLPVVDALAVAGDVVADLQQQGDGELPHRRGAIGRHIGDRDAPPLCSRHIHHIVPGGQHCDITDRGAGLQDLFGDGDLVGENDLALPDAADDLLGRMGIGAVIHLQAAQSGKGLPAEIAGVFGVAIQHHDGGKGHNRSLLHSIKIINGSQRHRLLYLSHRPASRLPQEHKVRAEGDHPKAPAEVLNCLLRRGGGGAHRDAGGGRLGKRQVDGLLDYLVANRKAVGFRQISRAQVDGVHAGGQDLIQRLHRLAAFDHGDEHGVLVGGSFVLIHGHGAVAGGP